MRPLLLTAIGLVTFTRFFWAPSFGVGALYYRDPYNLCGLTSCASARDAATLKARQGPIKKHGTRDFFVLSFPCPHHVEGIGILGDGGKWVCGMDAKQENCVIYSFGINDKSSFEAALLERAPGCEVWRYDFSVDSDSPKYYTLDALMKLNGGHTFIDMLKIDVEGAEFDTLTAFLATHKPLSPFSSTTLPIGQLQIELHARDDYGNLNFWWAALEATGLRPFWTESNLVYVNYNAGGKPRLAEYSFMNIRGNHSLVYEATSQATGGADAY
ncbi:hypothetical protein EDB84DRAFT_1641561 [Lactarius hengduanensis]|nr:hypothetical protein EDB84DRAFT_1641561 [Lactarius hengduanensis]